MQAQKLAQLGMLVSGIAHEISNPSNIMLLSTAGLRQSIDAVLQVLDAYAELNGDFAVGARQYGEIRPELAGQVDVLERSAERIQDFVHELKDFARREDAELTPRGPRQRRRPQQPGPAGPRGSAGDPQSRRRVCRR